MPLTIAEQVVAELIRARAKHSIQLTSRHEDYAVILEELDEVWDHVKNDTGQGGGLKKELLQVAAMCIRMIEDLKL